MIDSRWKIDEIDLLKLYKRQRLTMWRELTAAEYISVVLTPRV